MSGPRESGFALLAALFLLSALAALAVHVATLSGVQHATVGLSAQGERAHFAARAGVEWAIKDIVDNAAANLACGAGPATFSLSEAALDGFDVAVTCTSQAVVEGPDAYTLYNLAVLASRGAPAQPGYVSRRLLAVVAI